MNPERVLQVFGSLNCGGAETIVMNLYRKIDREKIQFDFVVHTDKVGSYEKEIEELGGRIYRVPKFNGYNYFRYIFAWKALFRELLRDKGIIHCHIRSTANIVLYLAKKYGWITIAHSHSTSNGNGISALVKNIFQKFIKADYYFACSQKAGEWLFSSKIVKGSRFYILKNAIDLDEFRLNNTDRIEIRNKLKIDDMVVYGHVGRMNEAKNHIFLLELFSYILKKSPKSRLVLIGDGELKEQIEKKINELHLKDKVLLLGIRSDVSKMLFAMDAFLFPSKWEGLPTSVIEAQAAGLPCFISNKVTKEVGVSELVYYLPIDEGYEPWVNKLNKIDLKRIDVKRNLINAGYDIRESAFWLQEFYMNL